MKLAKATPAEVQALTDWFLQRETDGEPNPSWRRVVAGYELLVEHCCDPAKGYLDFKPGTSPAEIAALRSALEGIAKQKLSFELETEGCFQTGYDECIRHARSAL